MLDVGQVSWQETRPTSSGSLPVFHRKFIKTDTFLQNILITINQHFLIKLVLLENSEPALIIVGWFFKQNDIITMVLVYFLFILEVYLVIFCKFVNMS